MSKHFSSLHRLGSQYKRFASPCPATYTHGGPRQHHRDRFRSHPRYDTGSAGKVVTGACFVASVLVCLCIAGTETGEKADQAEARICGLIRTNVAALPRLLRVHLLSRVSSFAVITMLRLRYSRHPISFSCLRRDDHIFNKEIIREIIKAPVSTF